MLQANGSRRYESSASANNLHAAHTGKFCIIFELACRHAWHQCGFATSSSLAQTGNYLGITAHYVVCGSEGRGKTKGSLVFEYQSENITKQERMEGSELVVYPSHHTNKKGPDKNEEKKSQRMTSPPPSLPPPSPSRVSTKCTSPVQLVQHLLNNIHNADYNKAPLD